jgi:hypothetical protein
MIHLEFTSTQRHQYRRLAVLGVASKAPDSERRWMPGARLTRVLGQIKV